MIPMRDTKGLWWCLGGCVLWGVIAFGYWQML